MEHFTVYTKPNCHLCDEMKTLIENTGNRYTSINMLEMTNEEVTELRAWARSVKQMTMPIIRRASGELVTNKEIIEQLEGGHNG